MWEEDNLGGYTQNEGNNLKIDNNRDIVPITHRDGTTEYHYRGTAYKTEEEAISAQQGPAWFNKAAGFVGKTLMSSPTIRTVAKTAGSVLGNETVQDVLTGPGEDTAVTLLGDSLVKHGLPRNIAEVGRLAYPSPMDVPRTPTKGLRPIPAEVFDGKKYINDMFPDDPYAPSTVLKSTTPDDAKYVQGNLPLRKTQSISYQKEVTSLMDDFGMPDAVFDLRVYDIRKEIRTPTQRRKLLESYLSPEFIKGRFSGFDKANRPEFAAKWADFLTAKGLHPVGDIQIHHINPLYDSIHLFDGVKFDSDQYWDIIETLIDGNARTGAIHRGEDVNNLMMTLGKGKAVDTPHGIAHKYLNTQTPTFFSKAEMARMANPKGFTDEAGRFWKPGEYRLHKADAWAEIVVKSEQVILEAHKQWKLLNPKTAGSLSFDDLVEELSKYTDTGYSKLLDPEFQLPDFNRIITQIANDKGLKGPIFQLKPKPVDLRKVSQRERMIKEADIAKETKLADKQLRELQNPKPDPNPGQTELDL